MMKLVQLAWLFLRVGIMNEVQYRLNFFVQILQSTIALAVGIVVLKVIFAYTDSLRGWSYPELLAVMGVYILTSGIIKSLIQPNMIRIIEEIREGTLDFVLTKPEDAQALVSVREVRLWQMVDTVVGAIVLVTAVTDLHRTAGWVAAGLFGIALIAGALMIYSFWLMLTTGAFWVVRMEHAIELFQGIYQAGRVPVDIYPRALQLSLTFLVPVAFAVTVPAEALTNRLSLSTLVGAVILAVALPVISRLVWKFGLRHYTGASA
jgi:ABC-2 type transport system permease protein